MSPAEVAAVLFGSCFALILLRVPVALALGLACVPIFLLHPDLSPILLLTEMIKAYNSFILLVIILFPDLVLFLPRLLMPQFV